MLRVKSAEVISLVGALRRISCGVAILETISLIGELVSVPRSRSLVTSRFDMDFPYFFDICEKFITIFGSKSLVFLSGDSFATLTSVSYLLCLILSCSLKFSIDTSSIIT